VVIGDFLLGSTGPEAAGEHEESRIRLSGILEVRMTEQTLTTVCSFTGCPSDATVAGMIDVPKHVEYWRSGAEEDWDAAMDLISNQRSRHGLFSVHLALEKTLKALVTRNTGNVPPKIHALLRLGDLASLPFTDE
jgi:hypothetical protein